MKRGSWIDQTVLIIMIDFLYLFTLNPHHHYPCVGVHLCCVSINEQKSCSNVFESDTGSYGDREGCFSGGWSSESLTVFLLVGVGLSLGLTGWMLAMEHFMFPSTVF
jgi:hypothetical protein